MAAVIRVHGGRTMTTANIELNMHFGTSHALLPKHFITKVYTHIVGGGGSCKPPCRPADTYELNCSPLCMRNVALPHCIATLVLIEIHSRIVQHGHSFDSIRPLRCSDHHVLHSLCGMNSDTSAI